MSDLRPKAVFLDVGWTLIYPAESMWQILAELSRKRGADTTPEGVEQLVASMMCLAIERGREGLRLGQEYSDSDAEFAGQFAAMCHFVFASVGLGDHAMELAQEFRARFWRGENWRVFPDVVPTLMRLRELDVRVGVLSNAATDLPAFLETLGIAPHLDFQVVSAAVGVKKPDPRIFHIACDRAGVDPREALHVGDMYLEDWIGASNAGIRPVVIDRGQHSMFPTVKMAIEGNPESASSLSPILALCSSEKLKSEV